jgi:hypothetical protein
MITELFIMGIPKKEQWEQVEARAALYKLLLSYAEVEGDKLKGLVTKLADDLAPCRAGDYVRTPEGYVYKIDSVHLLFENDKPDAYFFQCMGAPVYENEDLGPVEEMTGFFKVIERVERPYH